MTDTHRGDAADSPGFVDPDAPPGAWLHAERVHSSSPWRWGAWWLAAWAVLALYNGVVLVPDPEWTSGLPGVLAFVTAFMGLVAIGGVVAWRRLSGGGWVLLSERELQAGGLGTIDPAHVERVEVLRGRWQQVKLRWQAVGAHRMLVPPGVKAAVRVQQAAESGARWEHHVYVVGSNHPAELAASLAVARERGRLRAEEDAHLDGVLAADPELEFWEDRTERREALRAQLRAERARWEQLRREQGAGGEVHDGP